MSKPSNVLRGTAAMYTVTQAPFYFTDKEARAEYARLRAVAEKRVQRLQSAGYKLTGKTEFKPLERNASEAEIYKSLADVAKFINMKSSTITGRKASVEKMVEKMHEHGYDFINKNNAEQFGEFMREAKKHDEYRGYDSEEVVELFHIAKEKHVRPEELAQDLDTWIGNESLINMPRSRSTIGADELRERLAMQPVVEAAEAVRTVSGSRSSGSRSTSRIRASRVKPARKTTRRR